MAASHCASVRRIASRLADSFGPSSPNVPATASVNCRTAATNWFLTSWICPAGIQRRSRSEQSDAVHATGDCAAACPKRASAKKSTSAVARNRTSSRGRDTVNLMDRILPLKADAKIAVGDQAPFARPRGVCVDPVRRGGGSRHGSAGSSRRPRQRATRPACVRSWIATA